MIQYFACGKNILSSTLNVGHYILQLLRTKSIKMYIKAQ